MNIIKFVYDIPEDKYQKLQEIKNKLGIEKNKDLFNVALTLLDWVIKTKEEGRVIGAVDEANFTYRQLEMPALSEVKQKTDEENVEEDSETDNWPELIDFLPNDEQDLE